MWVRKNMSAFHVTTRSWVKTKGVRGGVAGLPELSGFSRFLGLPGLPD